ncbi:MULTISPECIES: hypothetical protein [Pseudoalteromonas]|uniref:Lipoprotein n=1 Tax=Pseudoalteromonas luteoviolacea (strain 2ta16) TaxID=1353533 RepID=V4HBH9_PSEL2|nr:MULTISPECIES: hypothetical protein [Pseudoalteromonas]ESP94806.1 hypothetical protein PL2TA16_00806 [Pseudoalteromonas luteoviolacea 2ta16]KZN43328.1 hypothetical protein N483_08525 [Pseudoalteromonas luteoviolacea NCIMB 1944]MCG7547367.1 hypothetical protein [Pseudoalteromonas sp. Of7M-16]
MKLKSFAALPLLLLAGCSTETTESKDVKTEAIWADIYVTSQGKDSRVIAELNVSGRNGNNIKLSDKDRLEASAAGVTKALERDDDFFDIDYRAVFNISEEGTKYTVTLTRDAVGDALTTTLIMPKPFTIITPQENQSFHKTDTLEVSWTDSKQNNTQLDAKLTIRCKKDDGNEASVVENYIDTNDDGSLSIDLASLEGLNDSVLNNKKSCEGEVFMERFNHGTLDSRFADSSRARAIQQRYSKKFEVRIN